MSEVKLRPLVPIVMAVAAVVGLRAWISLRGYLYADDFAFRFWAQTQPLGWDYLTQSYGGHVNPVGLFNQWVLQHWFPGSHTALAVLTLVLWTLTLVLAAATALLLTDRWTAGVLMVAMAGLSLFGFENTTWWAAAIYAGPYQLFLVAGVYCIVRALRTGTRWPVWLAVVCVALAGLSYSRGFMSAVLLFIVAVTVPVREEGRLGIRAALRWAPGQWAAMAAAAATTLALVLFSSDKIARPDVAWAALPGYLWNLLVLNVLPAVWGGPWRWFEIPPEVWRPIVTAPAPPWWAVWLFGFVTIAAVVVLLARRRHLRALLAGVVAFVLMVLLIAGIARSGTIVASVAYRYTFDLVWPVTLLFVLAVVPLWWQPGRPSRLGWVVTACVLAGALFSTVVPAGDWTHNQAKEYMARAASGFPRIPPGQWVLNQGVPFDLIHPALMAPYANALVVMSPVPGAPWFGPYAPDEMYGFGQDGSVQKQDVQGPRTPNGPDPKCGYRITDQVRTLPLDGTLIDWDFYARVAYFSGVDTTLNIAFGGQIQTVPLVAGGLRAVYLPVSGPGDKVGVSVGTPGAVVCVTEIRVGNRVEADGETLVPLPVTKPAQ